MKTTRLYSVIAILLVGALIMLGSILLPASLAGCGAPTVSLVTLQPQRLRMVHLTTPDCTIRLLAWDEGVAPQHQGDLQLSQASADIQLELDDRIVTARLQAGSSRTTGFSISIGDATGTVLIERPPGG